MFLKFLQQAIKERGDISHAYLITGEVETATAEVISALKNIFPDVFSAGTDISVVETGLFGVDQSRRVRQKAENRPFGGRAIFVLCSPVFTPEAQNALLKTLEEPEPGNYFFIVTESAESLLATLRSRLVPFSFVPASSEKQEIEKIKSFLSKPPKERLLFVSELYNQEEKAPILAFLFNLEEAARMALLKNTTDKALFHYLEFVAKSRGYLKRSGTNTKLILETLALAAPSSLQKNKSKGM